MGLIDEIADLMLREGDIKAQQARERIASDEERRQAKHRVLRNTLKGLAMFGPPLLLPGGSLAGLLGSRWAALGLSPFERFLMNSGTSIPRTALGTSAGRRPSGLGYSQFFGPVGRDDWYQAPWDEEGIG